MCGCDYCDKLTGIGTTSFLILFKECRDYYRNSGNEKFGICELIAYLTTVAWSSNSKGDRNKRSQLTGVYERKLQEAVLCFKYSTVWDPV